VGVEESNLVLIPLIFQSFLVLATLINNGGKTDVAGSKEMRGVVKLQKYFQTIFTTDSQIRDFLRNVWIIIL